MKKEDLKTGMRVIYANGGVGIVLADINVIGLKGGGFCYADDFDENLKHLYTNDEDGWYLVKVYEGFDRSVFVLDFNKMGRLLWERKPEKSESQKQLDNVMAKLAELQKEAEQLQETIKKEKK